MAAEQKTKKERIKLPEGRLINHNLFERDRYKDPKTGALGKPRYKAEVAFERSDIEGEGTPDNPTIEDQILAYVENLWGKPAVDEYLDGKIEGPFLDGDFLKAKREKNGKAGDAYGGKLVVRMDTDFNREGNADEGGAEVYDEELKEVGKLQGNAASVYQGCYGHIVGVLDGWEDAKGVKHLKFYLAAFQKTRDGEKLMQGTGNKGLFAPVGRAAAEAGGGRRRRVA